MSTNVIRLNVLVGCAIMLVVVASLGCRSSGTDESPEALDPIEYKDGDGPHECVVWLYLPSYPLDIDVQVWWDDEQVFAGRLSGFAVEGESDVDLGPMPNLMMTIMTQPGSHTLKVTHKDQSQEVQVNLGEKGQRVFMLGEHLNDGGHLIKDLGENASYG